MTILREKQTTAPATSAVDLQQAKAYLRIADSDVDDDALLVGFINAATSACEAFTGKGLITQVWTGFLDHWPATPSDNIWEGSRQGPASWAYGPPASLPLSHGPLQSVASIETFDDSDVATVYAATNYFVDTASDDARITLRTSASRPIATRLTNGIKVVYTVGYGDDAADVPEQLRLGILGLVAHLSEHRGDDDQNIGGKAWSLPPVAKLLWTPYRKMSV
jgi:uncharacterized phiE125 gp8 family phage protein